MANDLFERYRQILSSGVNKLSSFVRENPTPIGFLSKQTQPVIQQQASRLRNIDIASTATGGAMKNYLDTRNLPPLSPKRIAAQSFPAIGAIQNIVSKKPTFAYEQMQRAVPGKAGSALGLLSEIALPGIGGEVKAGKGIVQGIVKPTLKSAGIGSLYGLSNIDTAKDIPASMARGAAFGAGLSTLGKILGKKGNKSVAKGFDWGRNRYSKWTNEDLDELGGVSDFIRNNKKLFGADLEEADTKVTSLARGYLPSSLIEKRVRQYGSNSRGLLKKLTDDLWNAYEKQKAMDDITLGIVGDASKARQKVSAGSSPARQMVEQESLQEELSVKSPKIQSTIQPQAGKTGQSASSSLDDIIPPGSKERKFITTVRESKTSKKDVAEKVQGYYTPTANKETIARAAYTVNTDHDAALKRVLNEPLTADTNAIGLELMRQAQNAGRFDEAVQVAEALAKKGTQAGQSVQAFSIWGRLTPEGMLKYAEKEMLSANEKMGVLSKMFRKAFGEGKAELNAKDAEYITGMMKKANSTADEALRYKYIQETFEYIGKKLPWGASDVLDEYRYNNMLSNPLTHLRNIWSNLLQTYVTRPATLAAEGRIPSAVKYEIGAVKALPEAISKAFKAFKEGKALGKYDDVSSMRPIKPKRLGWKMMVRIANWPSTALESMDEFFSTLIQGGEKFRGAPEDAYKVAQKYLFRGDLKPTGQGALLNKIDDLTRATYALRNVGLGWFIPFVRTPMNVAKQWIEYSPVGLATLPGSANKREQLAKAFLGSMATLYGASLAMEGRTTWAAPTDEKQKKLFYDTGRKPYSIKVGDRWIPMQTFGTFAYALGIPAAVKYYNDESRTALTDSDLDKLIKNVSALGGFWSNQTFVSGLGSFVQMAEGNTDYTLPKNIAYTVSQLKPMAGLMRYVSTIVDPIYRKPGTFEEQMVSDVPFMTKDLPFYETTLGTPATRNMSNYVMPYAQGIENKAYEEPYQLRTKKLQQNAVINQKKKELEQQAKSGLTGVQATETEPQTVEDLTRDFKIDLAKEDVRYSGKTQTIGDTVIYKDGDSVRTLNLDHTVKEPELTGQAELDKKKISKYKSAITTEINNIVKLQELGVYDAEQAEKLIQDLKTKSAVKTGTGTKKKKAAFKLKVPKMKIPKIQTATVKKITLPKPKAVKRYSLKKTKVSGKKIKVPKIKTKLE